jgi:soluble lytic murein transglycosylase-like protein
MMCFGEKGSTTVYQDYINERVMTIIRSCRVGSVEQKHEATMFYSKRYGHNPILIARLIRAESSYDEYKYNKYSTASGLMQIVTNIHDIQSPFSVDDSIKYGCMLLDKYYDGCYDSALSRFGGWTLKKYSCETNKRAEYINKILQERV